MHYKTLTQRIIVATLAIVMSVAAQARIFAVCVGINDYPSPDRLNKCVADADSVKYIYDHQAGAQTTLLLNNRATKANIRQTMASLFANAASDDIIVFYFSGHGYPGGFVAIDGNLPYADIRRAFAASRARHKMIFADACFAGKMRTSKRSSEQQSQMQQADVMLFLASRSNEKSLESSNMPNGHFTNALKRGLRGAADTNRDRTITARELFTYVSQKVKNTTQGRQHPVMWGRFDDNMPVISW